MTLLDELFRTCDSLFLQRVDAVASVSIFRTPICLTNGATVAVRSKATGRLTFTVNSDDLGLGALIVPGFEVQLTGVGVPGTAGAADAVVWTAAALNPKPGRLLNFQLPNENSLAFEIERVSGSITTTLSEITPPAFVDDARGQPAKGAILLEGPAETDALEIVTSYGPVAVSLNRIQLVAIEQLPQAPGETVAPVGTKRPATDDKVPTFTVKLKPSAHGSGGDFRIAGMAVPFNMKLVGAGEAWSCSVQLEGTPGLVTVTLIVTSDDAAKP